MPKPLATQTLTGPSRSRSDGTKAFLFLIVAGHDVDVTPARYCIDGIDSVVLGRGDGSATRSTASLGVQLRIDVADGAMSGEHAALVRSAAGWLIRDLGSKNGVFVDGTRVQTADLKPGSLLELGRTFLTIGEHVGQAADQIGPALRDVGLGTLLPAVELQFKHALQVAESDIPVVITGETGTGKELVTRAIHKASKRSGQCIAVNCGAIAPNLIESELFGYRKGAFSGAVEDRPGLIRSADRGTLFLDEIGELPAAVQVALLRALEQKAVMPVGGTTEIPVDFRLCSATHRDLRRAVQAGTFRADLFARISGFTLELPPLRNRREDFGVILSAIARRLARHADELTLTNDALRAMLAYEWPQNIRELSKAMETGVVLARGEPIDVTHLNFAPPAPASRIDSSGRDDPAELRRALVASLERHRGNLSAVAREFEKDRVQIRRWMQRFQIDLSQFRSDTDED